MNFLESLMITWGIIIIFFIWAYLSATYELKKKEEKKMNKEKKLREMLEKNEEKREKIIEPVVNMVNKLMEGLDEDKQIIAGLDIITMIITSFDEEEQEVMIKCLNEEMNT